MWSGSNLSDDEDDVESQGSWRSKDGKPKYSRSSSNCSLDSLALPWKMEVCLDV